MSMCTTCNNVKNGAKKSPDNSGLIIYSILPEQASEIQFKNGVGCDSLLLFRNREQKFQPTFRPVSH